MCALLSLRFLFLSLFATFTFLPALNFLFKFFRAWLPFAQGKHIRLKPRSLFLNFGSLEMCGFQLPRILATTHHQAAMAEKHWPVLIHTLLGFLYKINLAQDP